MRFVIKCKAKDLKTAITKAWTMEKYNQNRQAQK
jgi:hypothetical protein